MRARILAVWSLRPYANRYILKLWLRNVWKARWPGSTSRIGKWWPAGWFLVSASFNTKFRAPEQSSSHFEKYDPR
jgi:hypothetical protein